MNDLLKNIVALSSAALEAEDKYIRESLSANSAYPNNKAGILRINNERYYQFVIARHLFATLNRHIELEENFIDLVIHSTSSQEDYEVSVEMKRWMSATGNTEIKSIRDDFDKLKSHNSKHRLMLIFSANPSESSIENNIEYLSKKIDKNVNPMLWEVKHFNTYNSKNNESVFWVAGYEVSNNCF